MSKQITKRIREIETGKSIYFDKTQIAHNAINRALQRLKDDDLHYKTTTKVGTDRTMFESLKNELPLIRVTRVLIKNHKSKK